jgi:hypothetical protein
VCCTDIPRKRQEAKRSRSAEEYSRWVLGSGVDRQTSSSSETGGGLSQRRLTSNSLCGLVAAAGQEPHTLTLSFRPGLTKQRDREDGMCVCEWVAVSFHPTASLSFSPAVLEANQTGGINCLHRGCFLSIATHSRGRRRRRGGHGSRKTTIIRPKVPSRRPRQIQPCLLHLPAHPSMHPITTAVTFRNKGFHYEICPRPRA